MKNTKTLAIFVLTFVLFLSFAEFTDAEPIGTAFTYQGHLYDANHVANGSYDFKFSLFDNFTDGNQVGSDVNVPDVDVTDGYFTVELDFGDVFTDQARWLEIAVRTAGGGSFTTLSPRQELTAVPYATHAKNVEQLVREFVVASEESVTAGDVVSFLDGYVQKFSPASGGTTFGSEDQFLIYPAFDISAAALSDTKFVVAYRQDWYYDYGTAIIGEVSGTTITWGSLSVFNEGVTYQTSVAALTPDKFVVTYQDYGNSKHGTAIIGTVSGSAISWGSEYVFSATDTTHPSATTLSDSKFVVAFWYGLGAAVIGDVSGTTISYGSTYMFNPASTAYPSATTLSDSKFVVAYTDTANSNYGTATIGTVSGNTISWGSEYVFNYATTYYCSAAALSDSKFVVVYRDVDNSNYGTATIGVVSGADIGFGMEYVFNTAITNYPSPAALSDSEFVIAYTNSINAGTTVIGTVSGANISWGPVTEFSNYGYLTQSNSAATLSSGKFVVAYYGDSGHGTAIIGMPPGKINLIGIAKESKTAGQMLPVIIGGISNVHSGLTPGTVYYSDAAGNLTTEITDYRIGLAISSTEILLNKE